MHGQLPAPSSINVLGVLLEPLGRQRLLATGLTLTRVNDGKSPAMQDTGNRLIYAGSATSSNGWNYIERDS